MFNFQHFIEISSFHFMDTTFKIFKFYQAETDWFVSPYSHILTPLNVRGDTCQGLRTHPSLRGVYCST